MPTIAEQIKECIEEFHRIAWEQACKVNPANPLAVAESIREMYEALLTVYQDINLQSVVGGSDELNIEVQQVLAKVERGGELKCNSSQVM